MKKYLFIIVAMFITSSAIADTKPIPKVAWEIKVIDFIGSHKVDFNLQGQNIPHTGIVSKCYQNSITMNYDEESSLITEQVNITCKVGISENISMFGMCLRNGADLNVSGLQVNNSLDKFTIMLTCQSYFINK